jgi:dolichol-phosphate mannosyltransferase
VWVGFRQVGVPYLRNSRKAGETNYTLSKMVRLSLNAITSFSYVPLQLATVAGFIIAAIALLAIVIVVILRLSTGTLITGQESGLPTFNILQGQATTLVSVLFLGGVQLIFLGIIGEYLGRIYDEVKQRPLYIVAEELGFDEKP